MRAMVPFAPALIVATVLSAALAIGLAPPAPERAETTTLPPPPTAGLLKAVSLGRHAAAADVAWVRTLQFIGAPHSERVGYAGLENWVSLINELDPAFQGPYFRASVLLATLPGRQQAAADILVDAEQNLVPDACRADTSCPLPDLEDPDDVRDKCVPCPALVEQDCNWSVALSSGFVAYFGQLDTAGAARFFCESRRRGGPAYLTPFTARLSARASSCQQLRQDLLGIAGGSAEGGSEMLRGRAEQLRVLVNCEEQALKHASQTYQLRTGRWPERVGQLLEEGLLEAPPWVPVRGQCWRWKDVGVGFELRPCSGP